MSFPLTGTGPNGDSMATTVNSFNPGHILVSEHHLLSEEEAGVVLSQLKVERDKLPKIKMDDPAIQYLASIHGEIKEGSVIRIIRKSETAGEFIAYRLVIKG